MEIKVLTKEEFTKRASELDFTNLYYLVYFPLTGLIGTKNYKVKDCILSNLQDILERYNTRYVVFECIPEIEGDDV